MRVSSIPASSAASGLGGHRDQPAIGIIDAGRREPCARRLDVGQRLQRGERLRRDHDEGRRRIERPTASSNAAPSMFDRKRTLSVGRAAPERVDQQRRAQHRAADADVQYAGDVAKRAGLDRVDQRAHALAPRGRELDVVRCAAAALGDMGRGAALARIDDLAGEQGIARGGEPLPFRRVRGIA